MFRRHRIATRAALALAVLAGWTGAAAAATTVTWDGQFRARWEYRSPLDYRLPGTLGRAATDALDDAGDAAIMRARLGARLALESDVEAFVQVQDSRTMGSEATTTTNTANLDVHQAYVDLKKLGGSAAWMLRSGRMELAYGDQHLVGALDWNNVGRAFDGFLLRWNGPAARVDAFATWVGDNRRFGTDRMFGGLVATLKPAPGLEVEPFAFVRDFGDTSVAAENGVKGGLHERTLGARARWARGRFDLRGEAMSQDGTRSSDDVVAWAGSVRATFKALPKHQLELTAEYMTASGDAGTDGTWKRFDPLYPTAHATLGYADLAGLSNIEDVSGGVSFAAGRVSTVALDVHRFSLAEARGAWVDAAGNTLRRDASGAAGTDLGVEFDLTVRCTARPGVLFVGGLSRFEPGGFVEATGGGEAQTWGFLQMTASF